MSLHTTPFTAYTRLSERLGGRYALTKESSYHHRRRFRRRTRCVPYLRQAKGQRRGCGQALFIKASLASKEDAQRAVRETVARFGGLHILFNNAGIPGSVQGTALDGVTEDDWQQVIDVDKGRHALRTGGYARDKEGGRRRDCKYVLVGRRHRYGARQPGVQRGEGRRCWTDEGTGTAVR